MFVHTCWCIVSLNCVDLIQIETFKMLLKNKFENGFEVKEKKEKIIRK